ncbi:MAG: hypothetical protein RDV00_01755 [Clostridia bacterium]|nr:hypothetical protein [Clostridia bacterium]
MHRAVGFPRIDLPEDEMKKWVDHIALICLSPEFQSLKQELEALYCSAKIDDAPSTAFSDALYAFLSEKE